jgi:protein-tyrosine phosphatase
VQLLEPDLLAADLIIAMKEAEHRPMFAERFPAWADRAEYWHIDDVDYARPEDALAALERNVRQLIGRLSKSNSQAHLKGSGRCKHGYCC